MSISQAHHSIRERHPTQRTTHLTALCIATACATASIAPSIARADDTDGTFTPIRTSDVPAELRPFVEAGTDAIAIERADLNGDGREDVLLLLQARRLRADADGFERRIRPLLILTRSEDGTLRLRKRNDKLAMCPECGGMMGDPLQSVVAKPKSFRVEHYGGSGWRWSAHYQFNYSRRDDTWQLVRIEKTSFHASEPEQAEKSVVLTPPKDYGKIDIADFDPDRMRD
ncbi:MAG: hypothetical protein KA144_04080 [Xanthomonadaceae bacterium]|nr:hypothetical protein [Xanthomonadaceae bacterium]